MRYFIDIHIDYRFLDRDNYLIFYRYEDGNVFVSRILYNRRDNTRILFGESTVSNNSSLEEKDKSI